MAEIGDGMPQGPQRVDRTGIALVHEGERIFPASDAGALLTADADRVVNCYFPVEIEVLGPDTADALVERIYDALQREVSALG